MVIITEEEQEEFINHTRGIFHLFVLLYLLLSFLATLLWIIKLLVCEYVCLAVGV